MSKQTGIKKLANGRFRARYFAGYDSHGKRRYPAKTFDAQSEAIKWRADQVSAKGPGSLEGHGLSLAQYLDRWLVMKKPGVRENTWDTYKQSVDSYIKPGLGVIRLTRLSASQIEHWQAELLNRVSATTVASARTILFGALKKAVRMGLIRSNPVAGTDAITVGKLKHYPLSVNEALALVGACASSRYGLLFELMLSTGLRPEELIGLCWADLEIGLRGVVRVRRVIHHLKGGGWRWHKPKTENGDRAIVFPSELALKLVDHRKAQLEQKLKAGHHWKNNDLVFTTDTGEPLHYSALHKDFKATLKRAKLPKTIRVYDLRHFFVTASLIAEVDAKTVSREAGHAKVSFTLDRYGHVLEEMHEAAADKREGLLKSRAVK